MVVAFGVRASAIVPRSGVERGWHCASARLEEEGCGAQHGAELARITHYACTLYSVQVVGCWRRDDGGCRGHVGRKEGKE
jgi:hypothetical protein